MTKGRQFTLCKPWLTHWENGDAKTALSTSESYCDDQTVRVDAEVLCQL